MKTRVGGGVPSWGGGGGGGGEGGSAINACPETYMTYKMLLYFYISKNKIIIKIKNTHCIPEDIWGFEPHAWSIGPRNTTARYHIIFSHREMVWYEMMKIGSFQT